MLDNLQLGNVDSGRNLEVPKINWDRILLKRTMLMRMKKSEKPVHVCSKNNNSCLKDACFIDQYFLKQLDNFGKFLTVSAGKDTCCIGDTGFRGVTSESRSDPYCSGEVDYRNGDLNLKILHSFTTFPYTGSAYFPTSDEPTTIEPFTSLWPTGISQLESSLEQNK